MNRYSWNNKKEIQLYEEQELRCKKSFHARHALIKKGEMVHLGRENYWVDESSDFYVFQEHGNSVINMGRFTQTQIRKYFEQI